MRLAQARTLYVGTRADAALFVVRAPDGLIEAEDDAPPVRAVYEPDGPDLDDRIRVAGELLGRGRPHLLVPLACPDGPPRRYVLVFRYSREEASERVRDRTGRITMTLPVSRFECSMTGEGLTWETDHQRGRAGFFLTGTPGGLSLFRVFRLEADPTGRLLVTLTPLLFATGLPHADFGAITDPIVRAEIEGAYRELNEAAAGYQFRSMVTRAKDVTEGVVGALLHQAGHNVPRDLYERLREVREILRKQGEGALGLTWLEFHLAHKIRLLHARTHPGPAGPPARPLTPELAGTVVADLAEILRQLGMAR